MQRKKIEAIVSEIASEIVVKYSFELVDVEYVKEGPNWYLRAYIDKPDGINIDDCQSVSTELGEKIEQMDILKQSYFLEVSSPGIDRPFKKDKDYEQNKGKLVEIKLFEPIDNIKTFEGTLLGLEDNIVTIDVKDKDNGEIRIEKEKISSIRCCIQF